MIYRESKNLALSKVWQHHVIPAKINHVLVSDAESDGSTLADLALSVAGPSHAEVTLCCHRPNPHEPRNPAQVAAALLREKGLTVFVEPASTSELNGILLVDASRSIDLIIIREHESIPAADWHSATSIKVARRMERPVIACGPFFAQNAQSRSVRGPVIATVSMRESSHQVVHAAGTIGGIVGAPVTILHSVDIAHEFSRPDSLIGVDCECQLLGNWLSTGQIAVSSKILCGPIAETVTRFAAAANASLIVVGIDLEEEGREAQRSDTLRRNLLMSAPCPVLFVPTFHSKDQRKVEHTDEPARTPASTSMPVVA